MTENTNTTPALPTLTGPSARLLIEYVAEEYAVTANDVAIFFELGETPEGRAAAETCLLRAGAVMSEGSWSLPAQWDGDPDGAIDAWMDRHGPNADADLLTIDPVGQVTPPADDTPAPKPEVPHHTPTPKGDGTEIGDPDADDTPVADDRPAGKYAAMQLVVGDVIKTSRRAKARYRVTAAAADEGSVLHAELVEGRAAKAIEKVGTDDVWLVTPAAADAPEVDPAPAPRPKAPKKKGKDKAPTAPVVVREGDPQEGFKIPPPPKGTDVDPLVAAAAAVQEKIAAANDPLLAEIGTLLGAMADRIATSRTKRSKSNGDGRKRGKPDDLFGWAKSQLDAGKDKEQVAAAIECSTSYLRKRLARLPEGFTPDPAVVAELDARLGAN